MVWAAFVLPREYAAMSDPTQALRALQEFQEFWAPTAEQLQRETQAFQGGWLAQMPERTANALEFQLTDIWVWGLWRAAGNMLIGMALLKWRVLTAELQQNFYRDLAVIGFGFGLPLIAAASPAWPHTTGNVLFVFISGQFNYWASLLVALGWVGFTISLWHAGFARAHRRRSPSATAIGYYILTSLICTFIFYGRHWLSHVSRRQLGIAGADRAAHRRAAVAPAIQLRSTRVAVADADLRRASTLPARAPFFARLTPNLNRRFVKRRRQLSRSTIPRSELARHLL
jgi:uncharacterized membrane protein YeiB